MEGPNDEETVTMVEVLKQQQDMEEAVSAVFGASDEKNCTYPKGYVRRQALYSCLTCVPESRANPEKRAGVCLACSLQCHANHELVELYTKRNFRCDCGGHRMRKTECKLVPLKAEENVSNTYNQNFSGIYCTCQRPYPDPEEEVADDMLQCIVCEDWYHMRHLDIEEPINSASFAEMVCGGCMERVAFLKNYYIRIDELNKSSLDDTLQVDVTGLDESTGAGTTESEDGAGPSAPGKRKAAANTENANDSASSSKLPRVDICTKPPINAEDEKAYKKGAAFWSSNMRKSLCRCTDCSKMYKELDVEFLLEENDTVQHYEEIGKQKYTSKSTYEKGMEMLSQMDRVQQIDMLTMYNQMHDRLRDFLDQFVVNQQVVTVTDVREFFSKLKKDQQDAAGTPPNFCR